MQYVKLGNTGLEVSRLCLGCMTYGVPDRGSHAWTLDEEESRPFIRRAIDLGINFFDTANTYSDGTSEEIVGRALKDFAKRDEVVIASKVFFPMREGPNGGGLSRKAILAEIDNSLRRLGTDYLDLYQIHRWDYSTPLEETLEALHDVVKAGKARYIGASSMFAWQFAKALYVADLNGWTRFVTMQNHLNLLYREDEVVESRHAESANDTNDLPTVDQVGNGADDPTMRRVRGTELHVGRVQMQPRSADQWAGKIAAEWRKATTAIQETGRLLLAAKEALAHGQFQNMVDNDLPFGRRTAQMLMEVARHPVVGNANHASHLPASWTTLYELTKLPDQELVARLHDGRINAGTMRKQVEAMQKEIAEQNVFMWRDLLNAVRRVAKFEAQWPDDVGHVGAKLFHAVPNDEGMLADEIAAVERGGRWLLAVAAALADERSRYDAETARLHAEQRRAEAEWEASPEGQRALAEHRQERAAERAAMDAMIAADPEHWPNARR